MCVCLYVCMCVYILFNSIKLNSLLNIHIWSWYNI